MPGDVVSILLQAEVGGSQRDIQKIRAYFGIDRPFHEQLLDYLANVARGNLGESFRTSRPVAIEIADRLPVTVQLTLMALLFGVIFGIPIGIAAAVWRGSFYDVALRPVSILGLSIPSFWLGTLLLLGSSRFVPAVRLLGYVPFLESPVRNLIAIGVPALALGVGMAASITRMMRSSMLEVLNQDFVRTARAKGLAERTVIWAHVFRNAFIPVLTVIGLEMGTLLGGSIVLEEVFALPGLGRLVVIAIKQRDYPLVQGVTVVVAILFSLVTLVTDLAYARLDPRIRYG